MIEIRGYNSSACVIVRIVGVGVSRYNEDIILRYAVFSGHTHFTAVADSGSAEILVGRSEIGVSAGWSAAVKDHQRMRSRIAGSEMYAQVRPLFVNELSFVKRNIVVVELKVHSETRSDQIDRTIELHNLTRPQHAVPNGVVGIDHRIVNLRSAMMDDIPAVFQSEMICDRFALVHEFGTCFFNIDAGLEEPEVNTEIIFARIQMNVGFMSRFVAVAVPFVVCSSVLRRCIPAFEHASRLEIDVCDFHRIIAGRHIKEIIRTVRRGYNAVHFIAHCIQQQDLDPFYSRFAGILQAVDLMSLTVEHVVPYEIADNAEHDRRESGNRRIIRSRRRYLGNVAILRIGNGFHIRIYRVETQFIDRMQSDHIICDNA